jgi:hypothetical protein
MGYIEYVSFPAWRKNYGNNSNEYSSFQYPVFLSDWSDAGQGQSGIYSNVHPACSHFTLLVAERNTPCTSVCLAVDRGAQWHTALHVYSASGGRKCIHPALLAVKRNTLWFCTCTVHTPCERVWWWKWYTLHKNSTSIGGCCWFILVVWCWKISPVPLVMD